MLIPTFRTMWIVNLDYRQSHKATKAHKGSQSTIDTRRFTLQGGEGVSGTIFAYCIKHLSSGTLSKRTTATHNAQRTTFNFFRLFSSRGKRQDDIPLQITSPLPSFGLSLCLPLSEVRWSLPSSFRPQPRPSGAQISASGPRGLFTNHNPLFQLVIKQHIPS